MDRDVEDLIRGCHAKLLCNFTGIALRHGCSPVYLLHILRTTFPNNTYGGLQITAKMQTKCEPLSSTPIPPNCWDGLPMDAQGPYPTNDYLIVLIDYRSRYLIVFQTKNRISTVIIKSLEQMFHLFG